MNILKSCVLVLSLFLFGCATPINNYAKNVGSECSKAHSKFNEFSECFKSKVKPEQKLTSDERYNSSKDEMFLMLSEINKLKRKKRISDAQAIDLFNLYLSKKATEERKYIDQRSHSIAAGTLALVAFGAVAATCVSNDIDCFQSSGSSGSSYQSYPCDCPYDVASDGSRCGKRSAFIRSGGRAPQCDVNRIIVTDLPM